MAASNGEETPLPLFAFRSLVAGPQELRRPVRQLAGQVRVLKRPRSDDDAQHAHRVTAKRHWQAVDDRASASQPVKALLKRSKLWFGENARFGSKAEKCCGLEVLIRAFPFRSAIRNRSKVGVLLGLPQQPCRESFVQIIHASRSHPCSQRGTGISVRCRDHRNHMVFPFRSSITSGFHRSRRESLPSEFAMRLEY